MKPLAAWLDHLDQALRQGQLVRLSLGDPVAPPQPELERVLVRPVQLKAGPRLAWVERYPRRDLTRNLTEAEFRQEIERLLGPAFAAAHLATTTGSWQLALRPKPRLTAGPPAAAAEPTHDRPRQRVGTLDPAWLTALGLIDAQGKPCRSYEAKLRQVHRFVELLDHLLGDAPWPEPLRVVDLGCGKGYLTFAAWDHLRQRGPVQVVGVERRSELVEGARSLAQRLGYEGLEFRAGEIADQDLGADLVIALHACDTATDDALAQGVLGGARWLVAAPCCHQELRDQLQGPAALAPLLRHGLLRARESDQATDALRAALLEAAGFKTRVFEFIAAEHTDKNLMISAVRRQQGPLPGAEDAVRQLAGFYQVRQQRLASRLGLSELLARAAP